jgi:diguanylate cyclase (GGDEF)-like protein
MPRSAGDDYMVATPVAGSSWRTVISTSRSVLLAPITKTARGAWLVFAAFAAAVLLILIIGATTLIYSARVARARLHDQLTGLPGRALFLERAGAAIRHGRCATLFLDLDGFKPVNDTYGHAAGDEILKDVASRLREAVGPGDYVSRFGGDEFLVLCPSVHDERDAVEKAGRIQQSLTAPYEVAGHTVRIGVSIGIATAGPQADHAEALIQNADVALYRAKNNGRGRVEQFFPDLVSS